jgi:DNA helicase HerA-like ATPase
MLPSLAAAHASGELSVSCWLRAKSHGPVGILFGGALTAGAELRDDELFDLNCPAGSCSKKLSSRTRSTLLGGFTNWERLLLNVEPLSLDGQRQRGLQLEDLFALLPSQTMAIAVVARPLNRTAAQPLLDSLSDDVERLQAYSEGQGFARLKLERSLSELRHLEEWAGLGLWDIEVWVGSSSTENCKVVAGLLSSSSNLNDKMLRVRVPDQNNDASRDEGWSSSRTVTADLVASLIRSPTRELPGLRVSDPLTFDITPEVSGEFVLGNVLDATKGSGQPFSLSEGSLNRHAFVTGATGSGKSQTVRALLEQLARAKVPWMVIEPAKSEYAGMAGRLRDLGASVSVIRPGRADVAPGSLNPLEPSSIILDNPRRRVYFNLQTHLDLVRALFTAAFDAVEPFPQILARALSTSYESLGWNLTLGRAIEGDPSIRPRFPTLDDLQRCALKTVDEVHYAPEVRDNVRGFVDIRIGSLRLGTPGRFFENGHPLDLERLLKTNVVFEIEDLGDDNDKAFFIGTVLIRIFEILRLYEANGNRSTALRHVTVIEEAHRLLKNVPSESPAAHAVTVFANLLAEVRSYGEGIVVAEQIPSKVISDVVKNSAIKLMHRLPSMDDRQFVGSTMNLTESQSESVVGLTPGLVAAHSDGMDRPVLVRIDASGSAREGIDLVPMHPPLSLRSHGCAQECKTSPCTLEELTISNEFAKKPAVLLWGEIVALGHLMGEPCGILKEEMKIFVQQVPMSRLRCAIGLVASSSVSRRSRWIRQFYDPRTLEVAIAEAMVSQVEDDSALGRPDASWQVGRFRWADVRRTLDAESGSVKSSSKIFTQPREWSARGLILREGSWSEVRANFQAAARSVQTPFSPTFLGEPNVLDPAAAALSEPGPRGARLSEAIRQVIALPNDWPSFRLYPETEQSNV